MNGRKIAWLSFALGIAVSVAGNIAHATSDSWSWPEVGGSAFWPLALMLSVEILTQTDWEIGRRWVVARFAGLAMVATVAFVLSYRHLAGLMTHWGEDWFNAHLGPFAVDGLMLLAATSLLSTSRKASRLAAEAQAAQTAAEARRNKQRPPAAPKIEQTAEVPTAPEESGLHVVNNVSETVAEEAARQAWIQSGKQLSSAEVGQLLGTSKATGHRRIQRWSGEASYR